jgi:hypothetical protein
MRPEVERVVGLGRMPAETDSESDWTAWQDATGALPSAATDEEALALLDSLPLGEDSGFGLVWSLLHFIESAPSWPHVALAPRGSYWQAFLHDRANRGVAGRH